MEHFDSFKDYFRFLGAKEFVYTDTKATFEYQQNLLEKTGRFLAYPIWHSGDFMIRNIRNPLFVTAIVAAGIALTTLLFYPSVFTGVLWGVGALKFPAYLITQSTILGVGLRTLGRLSNSQLMMSWDARQIEPLRVGSIILKNNNSL